jgi:hypothetical protein
MDKAYIESLDELEMGDYEDLFSDEIRPELVLGMNGDTTVRCHDGVWRPFQAAQSHGLRTRGTTETEDSLDPSDKESYLEY